MLPQVVGFNLAFEIVDLPAPDGDDNTSIKPRLEIVMAVDFSSLLNVLHLLAKLVYDGLEFEPDVAQLGVAGFSAQCIGFAVQFLHQEVEPPTNGLVPCQDIFGFPKMNE